MRHSGGGIVVAPESPEALAKAMVDLFINPVKAAQLGQKGRQFALEYYSFQQALDRYEMLFAEVIANSALTDVVPKFGSRESVVDA